MESNNAKDTSLVPPRTPAEELVAALYGSLLNREAVGIYDNFYEIGGNPSLADQLLSALRSVFRLDMSDDFIEAPTVEGLINALSKKWGGRDIVDEIAWTFKQVERLSNAEVEAAVYKSRLRADSAEDGPVRPGEKVDTAEMRKLLFESLLAQTGIRLDP